MKVTFPAEMIEFTGKYESIPLHMQEAIRHYIFDKASLGNFLTAVICNDLKGAFAYADKENLPLIHLYVEWFYWECPSKLVGKENYSLHLKGE